MVIVHQLHNLFSRELANKHLVNPEVVLLGIDAA